MKAALTRAADRDKTRRLLDAVMRDDLTEVQDLVEIESAEGGMNRDDVDDMALAMDGANTQMFAMLNLHDAGKALNAPLYFAAFRGQERIVNYLLNNTDFCQESLNAALFGAAAKGAEDIATRLIDLGADAACADGACVEVAIAKGHEKLAQDLLAAESYTAALAAYIDRGQTDQVIELLAGGAEPVFALKAVCRQLSDYSAARDTRQDAAYCDAFDIILSYATGHGDDIPALLHDTMAYAIDRGARAVIEKIIDHPEYARVPDRQSQIDAAISFAAAASFRGFNPATYFEYESLAGRLLDLGADAQIALEQGASANSVGVTRAALAYGADPRRHGRDAMKRAFTAEISALLDPVEKKLDQADYAALEARGLTVETLRATEPELGRSGLMIAAAGGGMAKALEVFKKAGEPLLAADLTTPDKSGDDALAILAARGQAGALVDRNLWLLRETVYTDLFSRLPDSTRAGLAEKHADVLNGLKSHRDALHLRQQAEEHRKRFRPK